ncbi:SipW-dependent-type signal peptide-containing protein [Gordonia sp. NPDC058843]|uniref:SipW-dependent-type signal peptide-containing protein n=1 Tax=Gordonia sp. NPDC058843 TaxID=3346648 RepID=UPI0036BC0B35
MQLRAVLSVGIVLGLGTVGTLAAWSATTTTTSGTFTTGTVDLWLNDVNATEVTPLSVPLGSALLPGQSAAVRIAVQSRGNVAANYTTRVRGSGAAGTAVQLTVVVGGTISGSTCTGTPAVTSMTLTGSDASILGTRGPLAAGTGTEVLCLQIGLPVGASNITQTATGSVVLTFEGTGVASV